MFDVLQGMFCSVTLTVSLLYGTRVCWVCGKKCSFKESPDNKKYFLQGSLPSAMGIYAFGFAIFFTMLTDGFVAIVVSSLTSSILLSVFVVSMAMPPLKREPSI